MLAALLGSGAVAGCGLLFPPPASLPPLDPQPGLTPSVPSAPDTELGRGADELIPPGLGTLRPEQISLELRRGSLRLQLTPLSEAVIRTATPDVWERLSALRRSHQAWFRDRTGSDALWTLILVTAWVDAEPTRIEAEGLTLVSQGIRYPPVEIRGVGPNWESGIVYPRDPLLALYAFPPEVRLDAGLEVEYLEIRNRDWARIFPTIEAERARIRGRDGGYSIPKR